MDNSLKRNNLLFDTLSWLFNEYNQRGIRYCILRNYQMLPEENTGNDIDMLIESDAHAENEQIFRKMAAYFDMTILPIIRRQYVTSYRIYKQIEGIDFFFLPIDVHADEEWHAATYLTGDQILAKRQSYKTFYVPHPVHEAIISWFSSLLWGGFIKEKYRDIITSIAQTNAKEFKDTLAHILGYRLADKVFSYAEKDALEKTLDFRRLMQRAVWWRAFLRNPLRLLAEYTRFLKSELKFKLNPLGLMIVIIGPDGAGKSTVAELAIEATQKVFSNLTCVLHWRPGLLPQLNRLLRRGNSTNCEVPPCTVPHSAEPSGRLLSMVRLIYYSIDFIWGYLIKVRPRMVRNALVLFDRYYYDFIVDPIRSRIQLPTWIPRLLMKFIPQPDAVIYLHNTPENLHTRKKELPLGELHRQLNAFQSLIPHLSNSYTVKTDRPLHEVVYEVISIILSVASKQRASQEE